MEPQPVPEHEPTRTGWRQLRAVLIALHVLAITLQALPAPGSRMSRSTWADPTVQGEFEAWTGRLNGLGVEITQEELEDRLWVFATGFMELREQVLAPFLPYYRYAGTSQSWRMFVAPHRYPALMYIELDHGSGYEPIYITRSEQYTWRRHQFDHDRMRALVFRLSWPNYKNTYRRVVEWIARESAQDFPEARSVRVRFFKYKTRTPQQVRAGTEVDGSFQQARVKRLRDYR